MTLKTELWSVKVIGNITIRYIVGLPIDVL